jgi:Tfp pilus assembly protein PilN
MTKINLLPPEKIKAKRKPAERSFLWLVIILPVLVLVLIALLYFNANGKVAQKDKALKESQTQLTDWQNKNAALKQYKTRQDQVSTLEASVVTALQGRVYWARILNNIAITMPSDIWITSLVGTSGDSGTAGTVEFSGYALQCPNRDNLVHLYPYLPDYKPIANWLERMAQIVEFQRVWLGSAEPTRQGTETETTVDDFARVTPPLQVTVTEFAGTRVIQFSSTATLNMDTAAIGGAPQPATPAATAAPSTAPEGK